VTRRQVANPPLISGSDAQAPDLNGEHHMVARIKVLLNVVTEAIWGKLLVANAIPSKVFLAYRPDWHIRQEKMPDYEEVLRIWTHANPGNRRDLCRLYLLYYQATGIKEREISGAIAEVGVWRGNSARLFRHLLQDRDLHLFDTFSGFDPRDCHREPQTSASAAVGGKFGDTSLAAVRAFVGEHPNIHYHPGWFPGTAERLPRSIRFALVHLDSDLYEPTKAGLEFFYCRLVPGGLMLIHDCANSFKGCRQAVYEFFASQPETPIIFPDKSGTAVIAKCRSTAVPRTVTHCIDDAQ